MDFSIWVLVLSHRKCRGSRSWVVATGTLAHTLSFSSGRRALVWVWL